MRRLRVDGGGHTFGVRRVDDPRSGQLEVIGCGDYVRFVLRFDGVRVEQNITLDDLLCTLPNILEKLNAVGARL